MNPEPALPHFILSYRPRQQHGVRLLEHVRQLTNWSLTATYRFFAEVSCRGYWLKGISEALYFLKQLRCAGVPQAQLLHFYTMQ